jgi:ferritin-like metal-binding protein YciE
VAGRHSIQARVDPAEDSMTIKTMQDFFIHELSDIYSAEKQLAKALPRLARASENQELSKAFNKHLEETRGQIERIDQIVDQLDIRLKRVKCQGMEGLVDEHAKSSRPYRRARCAMPR